MNRNLFIFAGVFFILLIISYFTFGSTTNKKTTTINNQVINLEIADTPEKQQKGLSQRDNLPADTGMLFIFTQPERHAFWMKDMRFPIDIIFLHNEKVVTIYSDVQPYLDANKTPNLNTYLPTEPINRVLEVNAGKVKDFGLKVGDSIKFNL